MSQALQTREAGGAISSATLEAVVVGGDLSKLNPAQRLEWYKNRCDAAGLDPRTQPFQYLTLQGKLSLYATKAATDQLIANRCLTVTITSRGAVGDLYEVVCRVAFPDGHSVEDMAALCITGLRGEALANGVMKCVTKAKRRTVLSACGLGMLDESEAETIPNARMVSVEGEVIHNGSDIPPVRFKDHPKPVIIADVQASINPATSDPLDAFGGHDNAAPVESDWQRANKRLRAIAGKLGKEQGIKGAMIGVYLSALIHDRYKVDSSKDCNADQLNATADLLDGGHVQLVPVLGVPDDIGPATDESPDRFLPNAEEAAIIAKREAAEVAA